MYTIVWKLIITILSLIYGLVIGHPELILVGLGISFLPMILADLRNNPGKDHSSHDVDGYDFKSAGSPFYGPNTNLVTAQQQSPIRRDKYSDKAAANDWWDTIIIMEAMRDNSSSISDFDSSSDLACSINPATGLPMVGDYGGIDIEGNTFGISLDVSLDYGALDNSIEFYSHFGDSLDCTSDW